MESKFKFEAPSPTLAKLFDCYRVGAGDVPHHLFALVNALAKSRASRKDANEQAGTIVALSKELETQAELIGRISVEHAGPSFQATMEAPGVLPAGTPLEQRALNRIAFEQVRRQTNLEAIFVQAARDLVEEPEATDEPVDANWAFRFFTLAGLACTERMQTIWGRVLSREVRKPRSFSFRTLEALKNATADIIDALVHAARLKLDFGQLSFIVYPGTFTGLEKAFGLTVRQVLLLQEIGAVVHDNNVRFTLSPTTAAQTELLYHGAKAIVLERDPDSPAISVPAILFTQIGEELSALAGTRPNEDYALMVAALVRKSCRKMYYADITATIGNQPITANEMELLPDEV